MMAFLMVYLSFVIIGRPESTAAAEGLTAKWQVTGIKCQVTRARCTILLTLENLILDTWAWWLNIC
jgi:hypothetical protein